MTSSTAPDEVLGFWSDEVHLRSWWTAEPGFDALARRRFGGLLARAAQGGCFDWCNTHGGRLAEMIALDQFSRNIHESHAVHVVAEAPYHEHGQADDHRSKLRHKAIIDRFGRYAQRNVMLNLVSTPEELAFLRLPGSRF